MLKTRSQLEYYNKFQVHFYIYFTATHKVRYLRLNYEPEVFIPYKRQLNTLQCKGEDF